MYSKLMISLVYLLVFFVLAIPKSYYFLFFRPDDKKQLNYKIMPKVRFESFFKTFNCTCIFSKQFG